MKRSLKLVLIVLVAATLVASLSGCFGVRVARRAQEDWDWDWDIDRDWNWGGGRNGREADTSGENEGRDYDLDGFTGIVTGGNFTNMNLYVTQGEDYAVRVETDSAYFDDIEVSVEGHTLEIDNDRLLMTRRIDVYVTAPSYESFDIAGAGDLISEGTLTGDSLDIMIAGAADVDMDVEYEYLTVMAAGAGEITLSGNVYEGEFDGAGASSFQMEELTTNICDIMISGAGDAYVRCEGELTAQINGAGNIEYWGNPTVDKQVYGVGSIRQRGE